MLLVVDASVAVKWLVREDDSELALRLFERNHELYAPRLLASEVGNALSRKARLGEIAKGQALELAAAIPEIAVNWINDEGICPDAVRISIELHHPVYDCAYLALAQRLGAIVVTADARFVESLAGTEYRTSVVTLSRLEMKQDDSRK